MNPIHIARNREKLGEFTPEEIRKGLAEGRFLPSDWAWQQGMTEWRPLSEVAHLYKEEDASLPGLDPMPTDSPHQFDPGKGSPKENVLPAWEQRENLGIFPAIVETTKQVLTRPAETFSAMPKTGGLGGPLLFAIAVSWVTMTVTLGYQALFSILNPESLQKELQGLDIGLFWMAVGVVILFMPLLLTIGLFFSAGIIHLGLMIFGVAHGGFETTFRVLAYTQGATSVLQLIPKCGGLLYSVWYFVSATIGLIKAHQAKSWRVILAVLLPLVVCCGLFMTVFATALTKGLTTSQSTHLSKTTSALIKMPVSTK
jgi:hypothetical protein